MIARPPLWRSAMKYKQLSFLQRCLTFTTNNPLLHHSRTNPTTKSTYQSTCLPTNPDRACPTPPAAPRSRPRRRRPYVHTERTHQSCKCHKLLIIVVAHRSPLPSSTSSPTPSTTPAPTRRLARSRTPPANPRSPRLCRRVCLQALRRSCPIP